MKRKKTEWGLFRINSMRNTHMAKGECLIVFLCLYDLCDTTLRESHALGLALFIALRRALAGLKFERI